MTTGSPQEQIACLPRWIQDRIKSCPAKGQGVHPWLFKTALVLHNHFSVDQVEDILSKYVSCDGREREIREPSPIPVRLYEARCLLLVLPKHGRLSTIQRYTRLFLTVRCVWRTCLPFLLLGWEPKNRRPKRFSTHYSLATLSCVSDWPRIPFRLGRVSLGEVGSPVSNSLCRIQ
jgi:hypothetical protein